KSAIAGASRKSPTSTTASIFGTTESVCSCTDVSAWHTLTATPTTRPTSRSGPAIRSARPIISRARSSTLRSSVSIFFFSRERRAPARLFLVRLREGKRERRGKTSRAHEGGHERLTHEVPAVDEHEEQDLERRRDHHGRQHEHAHRDQDAGDDEVDHEERQEEQEAHLEGCLELGEHEGRHDDLEGQVLGSDHAPVV